MVSPFARRQSFIAAASSSFFRGYCRCASAAGVRLPAAAASSQRSRNPHQHWRCRHLASTAVGSTSSTNSAFDRRIKARQRDNAARAQRLWREGGGKEGDAVPAASKEEGGASDVVNYDYFREEIAARLVDRLDDIRRDEGFPLALDLGSGPGFVYNAICADDAVQDGGGGIGGVLKLVQLDSSSGMLYRDEDAVTLEDGAADRCDTYRMHVEDEEKGLPFPDGTFDLVISSASIHWVNNLPGLFKEVNRVLKPDGCFLLAMVGGTSLPELRASLVAAELERDGGVSPHVGPFVQLSDVGALLQGAGFALPTVDVDTVRVAFPNAAVLMEHLQRMGEGNACLKRRDRTPLDVFLASACLYDEMFPFEGGEGGEVEASIQIIYAIGWTPHESQQRPLERGTATHTVGEIVTEPEEGDDKK